jgi:hypothetical protein
MSQKCHEPAVNFSEATILEGLDKIVPAMAK